MSKGKIEKIKNNQLIGGTDNTDLYPITSTKAVFDENDVSQDYLNKHITGDRIESNTIPGDKLVDKAVTEEKVSDALMDKINSAAHGVIEEFETEVREALEKVVNTVSINNDTPLQPDVNKNINITVPEDLADLNGDSNHRTVTDAEKTTWNGKQNALTFDNVPTANSNNPVKSGGVYQAIQDIDVSSQISGKADKSEMSVVAGTGANADKTTITLKSGTSATVLTQHQDVSGKEDKSNKVTSFSSPTDTQYPSAKLVSDQLATKQGTISDLSTIRSNAAAGATAYQKPGTGIPKTDLASAVQTSLGKADTAIQSLTIGTTTTGAAGSSASVTNTGTATEPILSFTIPQGAQGVKGDTVIIGDENSYTLYNTTGDAVDGAMTQQAVTRELTELSGKVTYGAPDQPLDLSTLTKQSATISSGAVNNWVVNYQGYKSVFLPVTPTHQYKIKANASYDCVFAMLVSNTYTNNTAAVFANGSTRTLISSGEEVTVTAGSNANYLWILTNGSTGNDMSPEYVAEYFGGVSTVKEKIDGMEDTIMGRTVAEKIVFTSGYIQTNLSIGSVVDLTPLSSTGTTKYAIIDVEPAEKLLLNVVGGNAGRAWAFIDSENKLLSVAPKGAILDNVTIVVPDDATKAIINNDNFELSYLIKEIIQPMFIRPEDLAQEKGSSTTSAVSQAAVFTKKIELQLTPSMYIKTNVDVDTIVDLTPVISSGITSYCIFPCKDVLKFVINAVGGNVSRAWAFIDSDNRLISHSDAEVTLTDYSLPIPQDASKIIINNDDNNKTSYAIMLGDNTIDAQIVDELGESKTLLMSQYGINSAIRDATAITEIVDLSKQQKVEYIINSNGKWGEAAADDNNLYGVIIKVVPKSVLHIESNNSQSSYFSILRTAEPQHLVRADFASGETGRRVLYPSQTIDVTLPSDAYYLYVYCQGSTLVDYRPSNVTLISYIKDIVSQDKKPSVDTNMVVPSDVTVLNVERKSHQFSDVRYTTQGSIVGAGGVSIAAGNKVGIPYTSCMEVDKFVGFDVTLKTFMTCVNNPYSLLYTENLYNGTSGYGFTYNGAGGSTNIGGYMGVVCNVFAMHAIGMKTRFDTGSDAYLAKIGVFDKIYNQSAQGLQIGDVWWEQGHNRLITNLWRSERGLITKIEMSESVHNFPQVVTYTPSAFDTLMASEHAIIYRCNELYKNINYEASPFVAVEDEVIDSEYTYNDDICTFAGDYASFREGQIIFLNYNLKEVGSWASIELIKENTVIGTYSIDTSLHRYDLTSLNLTHGLYKARMSDGNGNYSDYTYFEIIDTTVTYVPESGDNKRITFSSTQGSAIYLDVCDLGGRSKAKYEFTDEELTNGYAIVNISQLVAEQYNNIISGETYIKVSFQGEYGRVCSDYLLTDL